MSAVAARILCLLKPGPNNDAVFDKRPVLTEDDVDSTADLIQYSVVDQLPDRSLLFPRIVASQNLTRANSLVVLNAER